MPSTCRWLVPCFGLGTLQCPKWMCSSCWIPYGGFLKWGYPCSSSIYRWDFPQKKHPAIGVAPCQDPYFYRDKTRPTTCHHVSPCFWLCFGLLERSTLVHVPGHQYQRRRTLWDILGSGCFHLSWHFPNLPCIFFQ